MAATTASDAEITALPDSGTAGQPSAAKPDVTWFGAVASAGRKAIAGLIDVDRALIGHAREAVVDCIDLGRETLRANTVKDVVDLHVARAHARVENSAANVREIVELTRTRLQEACAPIREAYRAHRPEKTRRARLAMPGDRHP